MNVLMIDHDGFQLQTRKALIENDIAQCTVMTASTLGDVYILFHKNIYDIVIIDHTIENGQQCIDYILTADPGQSVLVVSDAIHCVIKRCGDCVSHYKIKRLFNPTPIHNIVRLLERFDMYECDHYDEETNKL